MHTQMARSAAPTRPANGTTNGSTTNGHGADGNGNGKAKPMGPGTGTGYRQLEAGDKRTWPGLTIERRFTRAGVHPYDTVEWETREAIITNEHGKSVFEQKDLEIPRA